MSIPGKKNRIMAAILSASITISCLPATAFAYDWQAKIRSYADLQVKNSDQIIENTKKSINQFVDGGIEKIGKMTYDGFALFEEKTGVNKQNLLYGKMKKDILEVVGVGLGVTKGAKNVGLEFYPLIAKVPTLPERTISFAYNYAENS